jgi:signal transduction histidine kinase
MNLFSIAGLTCGISSSALALLALLFGKTRIHRILAFFNISVAIWGFGGYLVGGATTNNFAIFGWKFAHIGGIFVAIFFYHMVFEFCELKNNKIIYISYAIGILFLYLDIFTDVLINRTRFVFNSLYYNDVTFVFRILAILWFLLVIFGFFELAKLLPKTKGRKRSQTLYIIFGFLTGFLGGTSTFLPEFRIDVIYPVGNFGIVLYCFIVTYAILKYRLLDIRTAVTQGAIFGFVYTLVLGIPFGLISTGRDWLENKLGQSWIWAPMLTLLFFATSGPFIYMFLQRKALNRILAEEKHAHNLLLKASQGMTQVRNLKQLLGLIVHFISKILKTTNAQIFLFEESSKLYALRASRFLKKANILNLESNAALIDYLQVKREPLVVEEIRSLVSTNEKFKKIENQMSGLKTSVIIPCLIEEDLLGFLALGDKKSSRMYTQDDLDVLTTLANQAALAIQNAQFFEEVKETQEQLYQAEKMATIGTMADGLSHQINNRFNALSLIAGDTLDTIKLVDKTNTAPEINETFKQIQNALQKIEDNVKTGGEIVRGLLKYSRPGEEGLELTSLDDVINASLDMAQYKVKLSEIDIIKNYDLDLPKIKMNSTQIQEVFFNLIDNAFFAIKLRKEELKEEGFKGEINISAEQLDSKLRIVVSDNGMGVKKEDFEKLFTPFFTTKASSKKGTGLGLFVIQKIITDTHKGKISVVSNYREGTTFTIELPIS